LSFTTGESFTDSDDSSYDLWFPRPDYLPNWLIKDFALFLAEPLASIFNASVSQASIPSVWKSADVVALPKVRPPSNPQKDLRPIALTPTLSKVLESFVCEWIDQLCPVEEDPLQFGCTKGASTTHCLVDLVHQWSNATDTTDHYVRILLLDFSRAFDHIDHSILINKWSESQLPPFMVRWKHSFLQDRQQRVKIDGHVSTWRSPAGGTPQGTKSGPRDYKQMAKDLKCDLPIYKFVDDSTTFEVCQRNTHSTKLQTAADQISNWCRTNKMLINGKKTKEIIIDFSQSPTPAPPLVINGEVIERVHSSKLLGVTICDDLSWDSHVDNITKKGSQRLYLLRMLRRANISIERLLLVYITFIRPVLEYACQLFHGYLNKGQTKRIENIQIRAMKIIMPDASYELALQIAELNTLEDRRTELCRRLFRDIENPEHNLHKLLPHENETTQGLRSNTKYQLPTYKTNRKKNSFINWCLLNGL